MKFRERKEESDMAGSYQESYPRRGYRWWIARILMAALVLIVAVSVVLWLTGTRARASLANQYPPPGRSVNVGDFEMHINCAGRGSPTVILEAGLQDFSIFWTLVQPKVAKISRVCSYDRAGYGWSEPSPNPRTSEAMVGELHALLAEAGVEEPYVLVGHSFGGALVRLFAHIYPDEVAGMVLVDAGHEELFTRITAWRKATGYMLALYRVLDPLNSVGALALITRSLPDRGLPEEEAARYRAILAATGYCRTAIAEVESFEQNLAELRATNNRGLGDMPLIVISRGLWDTLPGISDDDNEKAWQAWQQMQSELAALSTNSKHVIAEQSGHFVQLQQPQLVIDAVREVVEANRN